MNFVYIVRNKLENCILVYFTLEVKILKHSLFTHKFEETFIITLTES